MGVTLGRRHINQPAFREAVKATGQRCYQLTVLAGLRHQSKFSALVNAESVPDTKANVAPLERIADVIGFDKSKLFVEGDDK
jgi:hypothetical protein